MYFQLKGSSHMKLSINAGVQLYQDTTIPSNLTISGNLLANQIYTAGDFQ